MKVQKVDMQTLFPCTIINLTLCAECFIISSAVSLFLYISVANIFLLLLMQTQRQ